MAKEMLVDRLYSDHMQGTNDAKPYMHSDNVTSWRAEETPLVCGVQRTRSTVVSRRQRGELRAAAEHP
jgi:hypothetical protein